MLCERGRFFWGSDHNLFYRSGLVMVYLYSVGPDLNALYFCLPKPVLKRNPYRIFTIAELQVRCDEQNDNELDSPQSVAAQRDDDY